MKYQEFIPSESLRAYVKCFYFFESSTEAEIEDVVFPGGSMEVIFNLGQGVWKTSSRGRYVKTPSIELWGQVTKPLPVRSEGKNRMLGIRFHTHGAAVFFNEDLYEFNDHVSDARDLLGKSVIELYDILMETGSVQARIGVLEKFLGNRLLTMQKNRDKILMIGQITRELQPNSLSEDIKSLACRYKLTPRYLQKLFLQYTGVTPKLYQKINRFQHSLRLVTKRESSLTSIAYDCGYFDQSHFIRDFKSFTGIKPSEYSLESFPVALTLSDR